MSNIVFMGMGEPMANLTPCGPRSSGSTATSACRRATSRSRPSASSPASARSTDRPLPVNLAVSLHAANDTLRNELVPINKRYPIDDLIDACADYLDAKQPPGQLRVGDDRRRQRPRQRRPRAGRPVPATAPARPRQPDPAQPDARLPDRRARRCDGSHEFRDLLETFGANATVRRNRGTDIDAACGQLAAGQPVTLSATRR